MSRTDITEYIGGRNLILEAIKAGQIIKDLYIEKNIENSVKSGQQPQISEIIAGVKSMGVKPEFIDRFKLLKMERSMNTKSQGIIALIEKSKDYSLDEVLALCKSKNKSPFIIILNNVLYEENLGAVMRTCASANVDAVIVPKRDKRDITPNVRRISMGGTEYVPFIKDNLFEVIDTLRKEGIKLVALDMNGTRNYFDENLKGGVAFLIGGESGLTEPLLKRTDSIVKIPMMGKIESLNMSVSTGIIIYEKIRQECQK